MRFPNQIVIGLLEVYQLTLSPQKGLLRFLYKTPLFSLVPGVKAGCRFYPTCSEQAKQNFKQHSFLTAFKKSLRQLRRCHNL